ncbi:MAG: hypothetical protein E7491_01415 [Ruminococcaceae bacterium]|nr:hypothetical protein [Oscillospiraceae bacterium]
MVKKLMKYELTYYFRTLGLFLPVVFLGGIMTKISRFFSSSDEMSGFVSISVKDAIGAMIEGVFLMLSIALYVFSISLIIIRFYKNMYSSEGYLTFTLPVSNRTHIFVKLFAAIIILLLSHLIVIASVFIALWGLDLYYLLTEMAISLFADGIGNAIALIAELIVMVLSLDISIVLFCYFCITIGQTAKKNRILKAFGVFFICFIIVQIALSTLYLTVFVTDEFKRWSIAHMLLFNHISVCSIIVINSIASVIFWFVTQAIMTKKLNLE